MSGNAVIFSTHVLHLCVIVLVCTTPHCCSVLESLLQSLLTTSERPGVQSASREGGTLALCHKKSLLPPPSGSML